MGFWGSVLLDSVHFSASLAFDFLSQEQLCLPLSASGPDPSSVLFHLHCFWSSLPDPFSGVAPCYLPTSTSAMISAVFSSSGQGCPSPTTCDSKSSHHLPYGSLTSALCFLISLKTPKQNLKSQSCWPDTCQAWCSSPGCTYFPRTKRHHRWGAGSKWSDRSSEYGTLPEAANGDLPTISNGHQAGSSPAHI